MRSLRLLRWIVSALAAFVAIDAVVAVARDLLKPPAKVVDRLTLAPIVERRPLADHIQLALVWTSITGSRLLCRTPFFLTYLRELTIRVGETMDDPASRDRIAAFVRDNDVDVSELDRSVEQFDTLNEFFARPLQADARPLAKPGEPQVAVVPADSRLLCSSLIGGEDAIEVKAYRHDLRGLLGIDQSTSRISGFYQRNMARGFAVATCRLAPGDYHRFHWPVDATWWAEDTLDLEGEYHSVAPTAVCSIVDVLGQNRRKVLVAESEQFGEIALVVVGALKVGSIELTSPAGHVRRGDELGVFRYGGSTVVLVFSTDAIAFDADLLATSATGTETKVQMGQALGTATISARC